MVVSSTFPHGHVVALTMPAWGHAKPLCTLVAKMVRFGRMHATLFIPLQLYERVTKEVDRNFVPGVEDELRELIRIVGVESAPLPTDLKSLTTNFLDGYRKLCNSEPINVLPTIEACHSALDPPQLILLDYFLYDALQGIRRETGHSVPIYALQPTSASALLYIWGPEHLGGKGDLGKKLEALTVTDDKEFMEASEKIYRGLEGNLVRVPGLPPMYDHEFSPQITVFHTMNISIASVNARIHRFLLECDGIVINTTPFFEKEAVKALRGWLVERPVICPAPFDHPLVPVEKDESHIAREVSEFLDEAFKEHGPHSVVYMSFGTVWWTTQPEKVWAAIDVLIECRIPFLFALASPFSEMPEDVAKKIRDSGIGYTSKWLPQPTILKHKACGWFVTHCGHNSIMEALTEGVPLICWPFDADQPVNAVLVTDVHDLGYELFNIRSLHGLKPIHRLGDKVPEGTVDALKTELKNVLTKARSEDGKVKRANAKRLRERIAKSWDKDGDAWTEIKRIVDVLHRGISGEMFI